MKNIYFLVVVMFLQFPITAQVIWGVGSGVGVAEAEFSSNFTQAGTFNAGDNPTTWTALSVNESGGAVTPGSAYWVRSLTGQGNGAYWGAQPPIPSPSQPNGVALFDSDFMDNAGVAGAFGTGSSPSPHKGELISPRIDLTGYTDSTIKVKFYSMWREFQVNELSVSFSTDDGATWGAPIDYRPLSCSSCPQFNDVDLPASTLAGVVNLTSCRVKFTFDGDYYYAMVDDLSIELLCTTPPTAVCQDITIYLDENGEASITASDIDNGSFENCSTGSLILTASQTTFDCSDVTIGGVVAPDQALIITGAYDGPLTGGVPKGVELYAATNIPDLSLYGVSSANNGGGTTGAPEFTFPAVSLTQGQYIYVASEAVEFQNFFGFAPDFTDASMLINGDDAVELFYNGTVVDVFGDVNTDGSGQPWEYLDGWAYRNNATGPDGSSFVLANWFFSGINALDNETTNASAATPVPVGTYVGAAGNPPVPVTLTVTDGLGNTNSCVANVTVLDTISPVLTCSDLTVYLDATGNATIQAEDLATRKLFFTTTNNNRVYSAAVDGSGSPAVLFDPAASGTSGPVGIEYRAANDSLYWGGGNYQEIIYGSVNGGTTNALANAANVCCEHHDLVFDEANARYFFTTNNFGIYVGNIDGSGTATQINIAGGDVNTVEYDSTTQKVFTNSVGGDLIMSMDDTGANLVTLFDNADGVSGPRGLAINTTTGLIFWTNRGTGTIMSANADGTGAPTTIYSGRNGLYHIKYDAITDMLFWTEFDGTDRVMTGPTDGSTPPDTVYIGSYGGIRGIELGAVPYSDNCASPALSADITSFTCADVGSPVTVSLTVSDASGNTAICSSIVTVLDTISPVVTCQDITVYLDGTGNASITGADIDNGSTDACGVATTTASPDMFTCSDIGTNTVTLSVMDANGNVGTCTATVTVADTTAPVIPLLTDSVGCFSASVTAPTTTDNCGGTITGTTTDPLMYTTIGTHVVTWSFDDGNGNTSSQTQNVIVNDVDPTTTVNGLTIAANASGATYQWIDCSNNQPIAGETSQTFTATANGDYAVIVAENGCTDTSNCVTIDDVNIDEITGGIIVLYPNPTNGKFTIDFPGNLRAIQVTDIAGREVKLEIDLATGVVDASNLSSGKYLVRMTAEDGTQHQSTIVITK